jgi:hypothetical protein
MNAPKIGDEFTSVKSGITGIVQELVEDEKFALIRIRLELPTGETKWTTISK